MGIIGRVLSKFLGASVNSFSVKEAKKKKKNNNNNNNKIKGNKEKKKKGYENYKIWREVM
jgi:hypothetical protein